MAIIKCPHCGSMISDLAPRCPKCGTQFTTAAKSNQSVQSQQVSASPMPPQPNVYQVPARETSGNSKTGLIIALVVAALLMAGGVYFGWSILSNKDAVAESEQDETMADSPDSNRINGYEFVDLGLSVKWATCNVGASSPSGCGDYYAWGELSTKSSYDEDNCETSGMYFDDISGDPQYDVARAKWGGGWRIPTKAEMQELLDNCDWGWTSQDGCNGYQVTSRTTGNSIFLPATGFRKGSKTKLVGEQSNYWLSTPDGSNTENACNLFFYNTYHRIGEFYRYYAFTIRPVVE